MKKHKNFTNRLLVIKQQNFTSKIRQHALQTDRQNKHNKASPKRIKQARQQQVRIIDNKQVSKDARQPKQRIRTTRSKQHKVQNKKKTEADNRKHR